MKYTEEQEEIFAAIANKDSYIAVDARAGSGKTSTVLEALRRKKDEESVLVISFNKKIASENQEKFDGLPNVKCSTFHSLAMNYIQCDPTNGNNLPLDKINTRYERYVVIYKAFADYCSSSIANAEDFAIANRYNRRIGLIIRDIFKVMGDMNRYTFSAMAKLYSLGVEGIDKEYDYIVFDEFADANECYIYAFENMKAKSKIVMFDEAQRLYAFNGAVKNITEHLPSYAKVMPLTRSFRCSTEIASSIMSFMAKNYDKDFKFYGTDTEPPEKKSFMVLTRGNLQLLKVIVELNKVKIGFKHLDSLERAMSAIKAAKSKDIKVFCRAFPELEDLVSEEELNANGKKRTPLVVAIDNARVINENVRMANEKNKTKKRLPYNIKFLQSIMVIDQDLNVEKSKFVYKNIIISTAHAIKGAEADTVYIMDELNNIVKENNETSLVDDGFKDEASEEDYMLYYVACSRAKTKVVNATSLGDEPVELEDFLMNDLLLNVDISI